MRIKLKTIIIADNILKNIIDNDKENKIDAVVKFKILTYLKEFNNPISSYREIENQKIEEYGELDNESKRYILRKDNKNLSKFETEINKLFEEEVNLNIEKIKIDEALLWGLTSNELILLYDMIEA